MCRRPLQMERSVVYCGKKQEGAAAMGKDPFNLFRFRSTKQEQKEREAYAAWAFPYGPEQQAKLRALLAQLLPKEDAAIAMVIFLMGKEAFCDKDGEREDGALRNPIQDAAQTLRRSGLRVRREYLPLYLALILADSRVDERLDYPAAEELREMAAHLP